MTTKINLTELMADREAGTGGEWVLLDDESGVSIKGDAGSIIHARINVFGVAEIFLSANDLTRIARLPALEAAYIEAVGLLAEVREHLADGNIGKAIVRIDRGPLVGDAQ